MKIGNYLKLALTALLMPLVFLSGVLVGNHYNLTDFLCPVKAEPYVLGQDFVSGNGIHFPEGTVIPLRRCAYMQRFNHQFAIDNAVELKRYERAIDTDYGFSVLYPESEQVD